MHITAFSPVAVSKDNIPQALIDRELSVIRDQVAQSAQGKPENIVEKMVQGRLSKFIEDSVLLEQKWVIDDKLKVQKVLQDFAQRVGASSVSVAAFQKFVVGEGIEKEQVDFAAEVKKAASS